MQIHRIQIEDQQSLTECATVYTPLQGEVYNAELSGL